MKSEIAEYLYTTILKPAPIKWLVNQLILAIIPEYVKTNNCLVYLNKQDPVISGALYFNVYEPEAAKFVINYLKEGDVFIDIGANVGVYTALAMNIVKEKGVVVSLEPDPESFHYLEKTVEANNYKNVKLFNCAASEQEGERVLYLSDDNRGDNRFHEFEGVSRRLEIKTLIIDKLVEKLSLDLKKERLFMKVDVQGSEGLVLAGARKTINDADKFTLMFEFWPAGLTAMATDPKELLLELESMAISLHELKPGGHLNAITDKDKLIKDNQGRKYVNIVGIKKTRL